MVGTREHVTAPVAHLGAALVVVALTACGGSSKSASTPSPSSKPTTTTTMPNAAADKAAAESLVLVQRDVPSGWVGSADEKDPADAVASDKVASCAGASDPGKHTADVSGSNFDKGNAEVGSEVTFAPSRAAFETDVKALRSSKYPTCAQSILAAQLRADFAKNSPGVTIDNFTVSRFSTPTYGEVTAAFRVSLTVKPTTGNAVPLYIDLVAFGQGRTEVSLDFDGQGAPFDAALERSLVATAAAKLETLAA